MMLLREAIGRTLLPLLLAAGCASTPPPTKAQRYDALLAGQTAGATPLTTGVMGEGVTLNELFPVYFDFDSRDVLEHELEKIKKTAGYLDDELRWFNLRLEGHADDRGSYDYNFMLGMERAANVAALLVSLGISPYRLSVASYGEEFPDPNTERVPSRALNRRVEFVIVP